VLSAPSYFTVDASVAIVVVGIVSARGVADFANLPTRKRTINDGFHS
jgi:hypothetical protein